MKYAPLIWAGLWRKPLRTTFTMLSLVAAFLLFGLLQGINGGFTRLLESAPMDGLFVQPRFFDIQLPVSYKQQIESLPGVRLVGYNSFINGYYQDPKQYFFMGAADENMMLSDANFSISKELVEKLKNTRNGFIANSAFVNRLGLKVGQTVPIKSRTARMDGSTDWTFELVAIVDREVNPGFGQFSYGNYDYFNEERATGKNTVSGFGIRIVDPEKAIETARAIDVMFANSDAPTRTTVDRLAFQSYLSGLNDFRLFVNATVVAVLFTMLLLTANTMMQSFRERIPEMAVLKTLGFSDRRVLMLVVGESLAQCMAGAVVGLALAKVVSPFAQGRLPQPLNVLEVPASLIALGLAVALIVGLVSAALPAWRANKLEIVDALAGR